MIDSPDIPSPKQRRERTGWDHFFPYYAGYPTKFADAVIAQANLPRGALVVDPWNGTGTTTLAAARRGLRSLGCDLNPVMTVIARARALFPDDADSIVPLANEIVASSERVRIRLSSSDPLRGWFDEGTARAIRGLERSVRRHLVGETIAASRRPQFGSMSGLAASFYVALFTVARRLVRPFRSTNPTWLRLRRDGEALVSIPGSVVADQFRTLISEMAAQLEAVRDSAPNSDIPDWGGVELRVADSAGASLGVQVADLVLTSPPYCTRIDYTAATRMELAVLSPLLELDPGELSRRMIGSTRVPLGEVVRRDGWGETCNRFLDAVAAHPSKASGGYYLKTHLDYFDKLYRSVGNVSTALKPRSTAVFVVQDSYYKEVHNDLPTILTDMAGAYGLRLTGLRTFQPKTSMARLNRYVRARTGVSAPTESVIYLSN